MPHKLIQPIEKNTGGIKSVALELPAKAPYRRRLRLTLDAHTLDGLLYAGGHIHAVYTSQPLEYWRLNIASDGDATLWCGSAGFTLTRNECASVRAWLEPLGLSITRYA